MSGASTPPPAPWPSISAPAGSPWGRVTRARASPSVVEIVSCAGPTHAPAHMSSVAVERDHLLDPTRPVGVLHRDQRDRCEVDLDRLRAGVPGARVRRPVLLGQLLAGSGQCAPKRRLAALQVPGAAVVV